MVVAWMLIWMLPMAAFGQQTTNQEASAQNARTHNDRGLAKQKKGDLNGAMVDYNQAIELNPQYGLAYRNRGNAKRKKGDLDGAIADFNRAIKLGVTTDRAQSE